MSRNSAGKPEELRQFTAGGAGDTTLGDARAFGGAHVREPTVVSRQPSSQFDDGPREMEIEEHEAGTGL